MKARMVSSSPEGVRSRVLVGCAYKRGGKCKRRARVLRNIIDLLVALSTVATQISS